MERKLIYFFTLYIAFHNADFIVFNFDSFIKNYHFIGTTIILLENIYELVTIFYNWRKSYKNLNMKLQDSGHLMRRVDSLEKTLILGGIGGRRKRDDRGWDGWMASPTWWTWVWANSGSWWCTGRLGVLRFMGSQKVGQDWVTEGNWTEHNNLSAAHDQAVILIFRYYFLRNTFCKFIAAF